MNKIILIGFLLVTRCSSAWWMTDVTPDEMYDTNVQFNVVRKNPPEGCNNDWWELDTLEVLEWFESSDKVIYMQTLDGDGYPVYHSVIKMEWD